MKRAYARKRVHKRRHSKVTGRFLKGGKLRKGRGRRTRGAGYFGDLIGHFVPQVVGMVPGVGSVAKGIMSPLLQAAAKKIPI